MRMPLFGNAEYAATISSSEASDAPSADGRLGAIGFVIPNRLTICPPAWIPTCSRRWTAARLYDLANATFIGTFGWLGEPS